MRVARELFGLIRRTVCGQLDMRQVPRGLYRETYSVLIEWFLLKKICRPGFDGWRLTDAGFRALSFLKKQFEGPDTCFLPEFFPLRRNKIVAPTPFF
ncbi:MAG: hypothetical protein CL917_08915 [Deltaproteobacteria bacterium]|nr:hypothetical protein [Deltaproteobacteria bacterium]